MDGYIIRNIESKYEIYGISLVLICSGIGFLQTDRWYGWLMGLILIVLGLLLMRRKYLLVKNKVPSWTKCPECKEAYGYIDLTNGMCPICEVKTIDMDEYYENK